MSIDIQYVDQHTHQHNSMSIDISLSIDIWYRVPNDIESEIRLFADDCVCYREIKDEEDNETSEGYWSIGLLGKEVGYEISTCQMQYDAADKKTDPEDPCFVYLKGTDLENVESIKYLGLTIDGIHM